MALDGAVADGHNLAPMDTDSFDWRWATARLRAGWRLVALVTLAAFLTSIALDLLLRDIYVSEAMLAVTKPVVVARFDDRLAGRQLDPSFPYEVATLRAYVELAVTDALAREAAGLLDLDPSQGPALKQRVAVRALADGSLLVIRARGDSPAASADLANAWAAALIERANAVFGARLAEDQVTGQRREALAQLEAAEDALAEHDAASELPASEIELERALQAYAADLEFDDRLAALLPDIEVLREQASGPSAGLETARALTALSMQLRALSAQAPLPTDLMLSADALDTAPGAAQIDALMQSALDARERLRPRLEAQPERLTAARAAVERLRARRAALERQRDLALERYMTLARKVDELALSRAAAGTELQLAATAVEPDYPDYATPLHRALTAALLGLLAGCTVAVAWPVAGRP